MSRALVVARRYAKALYEIALQDGRTVEVEQELQTLVSALNDESVQKFLLSPNISRSEKWNVLEGVLGDKLSKPVVSMARLLVERERTDVLLDILDAYVKITGEALGLADAIVYTAHPLTDEEQRAIESEFGAMLNKKIRVQSHIDKELLGGIKVRIGDVIYDGSLSGKLERLEKSFRRQAL
ncbi:F0F1 ATP synthase subunit delta [Paenibacillus motobuensis]|uniref:F0F1 ATP synthase subunit delta n=1 Tax=Paenibacillus TaxID=44249 RepID=UPI0020409921|nr:MULTISPECIES: F0F1 ATP synthase subunit delta [Paenibacillus]MCM3040981.1 F0F1 ATP synthase subunit delta [Paenibacillus lutimineralis]MCM3648085.1 F0F1 ATP synthase subunit delta [Paenibacillus motobuensis]